MCWATQISKEGNWKSQENSIGRQTHLIWTKHILVSQLGSNFSQGIPGTLLNYRWRFRREFLQHSLKVAHFMVKFQPIAFVVDNYAKHWKIRRKCNIWTNHTKTDLILNLINGQLSSKKTQPNGLCHCILCRIKWNQNGILHREMRIYNIYIWWDLHREQY